MAAKTLRGGFTGVLDVAEVRTTATRLFLFGDVTGILRDSRYPRSVRVTKYGQAFPFTLSTRSSAGGCRTVRLSTVPHRMELHGLRGTTARRVVDLRATARTRRAVCSLARAVDAQAAPSRLARLLLEVRRP